MTDSQVGPGQARATSPAGAELPQQLASAPSLETFSGRANEHGRHDGWHPTVAQLADWNALFTAVKARLRSIATTPDFPRGLPPADARRHPVIEGLLDCVSALDLLHAQLVPAGDAPGVDGWNGAGDGVVNAGGTGPLAPAPRDGVTGVAPSEDARVHADHREPNAVLRDAAAAAHVRPAHAATGSVQPADVLAWMPGEDFLRRRIACDASQDATRGDGFALLRLAFPGLDVHAGARRLLDAAAQVTGNVALADARTGTRHGVRDALLIAIAARLRGALKRQDVITRLSADEFCCLLAGASSPEALSNHVSRVVSAVSLPFAIEGEQWIVRPVFGVSCFPEDGSTADELLRFASCEQDDRSWWRRNALLPERDEER